MKILDQLVRIEVIFTTLFVSKEASILEAFQCLIVSFFVETVVLFFDIVEGETANS